VVHRLAVLTAAATLVLILFGGLVTNTGSALAVPDWPTTFGYNMFFYPWSGMVGGVLYEHGHRLIGSVVGALTLALAAGLWLRGGALRVAGLVAVVAVVGQGVLGGLRVVLLQQPLAILHGCVAPAFFALVGAIAFTTSQAARAPVAAGTFDGALRAQTFGAALVIYGQIVLGALLTHTGLLGLHLVGALAVFAFVLIVTARVRRTADPVAASLARVLLALLGLQLLLGGAALVTRLQPTALPAEAMSLVVFVAHRLVASVILGVAVVLALRFWTPAVRSAASSAGSAGATSWGEVGKGGEAPLPETTPLPGPPPLRGL
jgi:cytochrome c oxidase assembly protein subunit 15